LHSSVNAIGSSGQINDITNVSTPSAEHCDWLLVSRVVAHGSSLDKEISDIGVGNILQLHSIPTWHFLRLVENEETLSSVDCAYNAITRSWPLTKIRSVGSNQILDGILILGTDNAENERRKTYNA
jgi:hypothetical protein